MAVKTNFNNGKWIQNWKFKTNESPFSKSMNSLGIIKTMLKIEKFAAKTLSTRSAWNGANIPFRQLKTIPKWKTTVDTKTKTILLSLSITLLDPTGPPNPTVVAPPPPKQPPPPKVLN